MTPESFFMEKIDTAIEELRQINAKLRITNNYLQRLSNGTAPEETEPVSRTNARLLEHIRAVEEENAKLRILALDRPRPMYEVIASDGSNLRFPLKIVGTEDCGHRVQIYVQLPSWQKKE